MREALGEFEQLVLFALLDLGEGAYGVAVRRAIEERTGRSVSSGALYTTLQRLENRGLVASRLAAPTPGRGGRPRKHCELTPAGVETLHRSYQNLRRMSEGLVSKLDALHRRTAVEGGGS